MHHPFNARKGHRHNRARGDAMGMLLVRGNIFIPSTTNGVITPKGVETSEVSGLDTAEMWLYVGLYLAHLGLYYLHGIHSRALLAGHRRYAKALDVVEVAEGLKSLTEATGVLQKQFGWAKQQLLEAKSNKGADPAKFVPAKYRDFVRPLVTGMLEKGAAKRATSMAKNMDKDEMKGELRAFLDDLPPDILADVVDVLKEKERDGTDSEAESSIPPEP